MPDGVDPRLRSALARQLAARAAVLEGGVTRVGWKLGMGDTERIGREVAVKSLHADAEPALEIGRDVARVRTVARLGRVAAAIAAG